MKIFIGQNRDGDIYICDNVADVPSDPLRTHIFTITDTSKKRQVVVNLKKYNLLFDSREANE